MENLSLNDYPDERENNSNFDQVLKEVKSLAERRKDGDLLNQIIELEEEAQDNTFTLIPIGESCSGKSTLINSMIALGTKQSNWKNYELIPSSSKENTYFTTIIKKSHDERFHWILEEDNIKEVKVFDSSDDLKDWWKKKDEVCTKLLTEAKLNGTALGDATLVVKIPNFDFPFVIYDTPGVSAKAFKTSFLKKVNNSVSPIFLYVKGCDSKQAIEETAVELLKEIGERYPSSFFFNILTKADRFYNNELKNTKFNPSANNEEEENNEDLHNLSQNFKYSIEVLDRLPDTNFVKTFVVNPREALISNNNEEKKILHQIVDYLDKFKDQNCLIMKHNRLTAKLKNIINKYEDKLNSDAMFTEREIMQIKFAVNSSIYDFEDKITDFFRTFPKDDVMLENTYPDMYWGLMNAIRLNDKTRLKGFKWNRENYINSQLICLEDKVRNIIGKQIQTIVRGALLVLSNYLDPDLKQKLDRLKQKLCLDGNEGSFVSTLEKIFDALCITTGVASTATGVLALTAARFLGTTLAELLVPGVGWAMAVGGIVMTIIGVKNYIGFWKRESSYSEIICIICQYLRKNCLTTFDKTFESYHKIMYLLIEKVSLQKDAKEESDYTKILKTLKIKFPKRESGRLFELFVEEILLLNTLPIGMIEFITTLS